MDKKHRNLFEFDIYAHPEAPRDADKFILRRQSEALLDEQDEQALLHDELIKKATLPWYLRLIQIVSLILGLSLLGSFIKPWIGEEISFSENFHAHKSLLAISLALLIVFSALTAIQSVIRRGAKNDPEVQSVIERSESVVSDGFAALSVPKDAFEVDIFEYHYKAVKGKLKPALPFFTYANTINKLFIEDGKLCIADLTVVYGIPLTCFTAIKHRKGSASFVDWLKPVPHYNKAYKKSVRSVMGNIYRVKSLYAVQLTYDGEDYEILIPQYDIQPFVHLLNVIPTEE